VDVDENGVAPGEVFAPNTLGVDGAKADAMPGVDGAPNMEEVLVGCGEAALANPPEVEALPMLGLAPNAPPEAGWEGNPAAAPDGFAYFDLIFSRSSCSFPLYLLSRSFRSANFDGLCTRYSSFISSTIGFESDFDAALTPPKTLVVGGANAAPPGFSVGGVGAAVVVVVGAGAAKELLPKDGGAAF
jgi:hypothetical protein